MPSFSYNKERNTFSFYRSEEVTLGVEDVLSNVLQTYIGFRITSLRSGPALRFFMNLKERRTALNPEFVSDVLPEEQLMGLLEIFIGEVAKREPEVLRSGLLTRICVDDYILQVRKLLDPYFEGEIVKFKATEKADKLKRTAEVRKAVKTCNEALASLGYAVESDSLGLKLLCLGEKK